MTKCIVMCEVSVQKLMHMHYIEYYYKKDPNITDRAMSFFNVYITQNQTRHCSMFLLSIDVPE